MEGGQFDRLARALALGTSRRNVLKGLTAGALGGAIAAASRGGVTAQADRVAICHVRGNSGNFNILELPSSAVADHLAHGDTFPTCGDNPEAGQCAPTYFEGFDAGIGAWQGNITAAGGVGLVTAGSAYQGDDTAFTRLGGYHSAFPAGGFTVSLDVYLDMELNAALGTDIRLDYTAAVNQPDCNHRRDFIFHVGTDPTSAGQFAISVSNNAPGWPSNPGRDPLFVAASGFYTLTHTFYDLGGGQLAVDLTIAGPGGSKTWTLSDPSDIIGSTVGGNRYAWFATNGFDNLPIDNSARG